MSQNSSEQLPQIIEQDSKEPRRKNCRGFLYGSGKSPASL